MHGWRVGWSPHSASCRDVDRAARHRQGAGVDVGAQPITLRAHGPQEASLERRGLRVGQGLYKEVERIAAAGHGRNDAVHFDGGNLVGGEDALGVELLGSLGVGTRVAAVELLGEVLSHLGAHFRRNRFRADLRRLPTLQQAWAWNRQRRRTGRRFPRGRDRPLR